MSRQQRTQRGISLIEAMVAMAVMAFGTMAVLGVQTSLRLNADISKQRNEAVRIAQETMEAARSYDTVDTFDALDSSEVSTVTVYDEANAAYQVETVVEDAHVAVDDPHRKTVSVTVTWEDRSGQAQSVRLNSAIHRVPAELGGGLVAPADLSAVRTPGGRNIVIPRDAVPSADGQTSRFTPPGGGTTSWTFDNVTGFITQVCIGDACTAFDARLLTGYVRFATETGGEAPDAEDAKVPPGIPVLVDVVVNQTAPTAFNGVQQSCAERLGSDHVVYYCAVPLGTATSWSGQSRVILANTATVMTEVLASKFRICRYTTKLGHLTVPAQMSNEEHPLDYNAVRTALLNQNFLVIRAGNGTAAFSCPQDDVDAEPLLRVDTYQHQPAS